MKKNFSVLFCLMCNLMVGYAQYSTSFYVGLVQSFGENMEKWCSTQDINYQNKIKTICHTDDIRFQDDVATYFIREKNLGGYDCKIETYFNGFERAFNKGQVSYYLFNAEAVSNENIILVNTRKNKNKELIKKCAFVKCNIKINGVINFNIQDLFYIYDDKIINIKPYEEILDRRTGEKKVKIDLSDIDFSDESIGFSYNYGMHFPVGVSVNYAIPWFMVSLDFGWTNERKEVNITKIEMTDIMNYNITEKKLTPQFYLTATPLLNLKYVAIGCGIGYLFMKSEETTNYYYASSTPDQNGEYTNYSSSSSCNDLSSTECKFMVRPLIKGFIPLGESWSLGLSVGYDYVFKYKKTNGFNFGIGLQYSLD